MAVLKDGVDFNSLDGQKAQVVILMIIPELRFEDHLKTLAAVSRVFSRKEMVDRIVTAATAHDIYHLIFAEEHGELDYSPPETD